MLTQRTLPLRPRLGICWSVLSSMAASMNAEMVAPSQEDMAVNLCSFIDGDLLAAALKDRPREASQAEEACANGTPSLVYQLSLGMV